MDISPHSPWAGAPPQNPMESSQVAMNYVQSPATPATLLSESAPATPSAITSGSCNCFTIISFYKNVVTHADPQNNEQDISATSHMITTGVSPGAYQQNGEVRKRVELQLLSGELRKLDDLLSSFQGVGAQMFDDAEVTRVMMDFLGRNIGATRDAIMNRTGDMPLQ
ncbi:hypothetical protein DL770_002109 [Monosporascus sp. CRB-9-2]|nr:hypothetical protein DL770_002109 [Monosporascus sp. CRB-9-2]